MNQNRSFFQAIIQYLRSYPNNLNCGPCQQRSKKRFAIIPPQQKIPCSKLDILYNLYVSRELDSCSPYSCAPKVVCAWKLSRFSGTYYLEVSVCSDLWTIRFDLFEYSLVRFLPYIPTFHFQRTKSSILPSSSLTSKLEHYTSACAA